MFKKAGEFEEPLIEIRREIESLSAYPDSNEDRIRELKEKLETRSREIFSNLDRWQKTLLARHPERPYTLDYIQYMCDTFVELHGDRRFSDDGAIVGGFAEFRGENVLIVGHQKGRNTNEKVERNFGMANPEGYRKALRMMKIANKFNRPIFTLIDTSGAYPGIGAEERGQSEAIARNLREMVNFSVPIIVTVTGEGGSGGALGIGVGDRVNMLEFSTYSVISPEGCAAILYKDASESEKAAESLKLTAPDLKELDLIDRIIDEVPGGAHADHSEMAKVLGNILEKQLEELQKLSVKERKDARYEKFREMGFFSEIT